MDLNKALARLNVAMFDVSAAGFTGGSSEGLRVPVEALIEAVQDVALELEGPSVPEFFLGWIPDSPATLTEL